MNGYTSRTAQYAQGMQGQTGCGNQVSAGAINPALYQTAVPPAQAAGTSLNPAITSLLPITGNLAPIITSTQPGALTLQGTQYLNGYLQTQIGRKVTVDFLIGTNTLVDKTGTLLAVGANYILINEVETDDIVACDFYTIKFVKFYY